MRITPMTLAILGVVALAGCGPARDSGSTAAEDEVALVGTEWVLQALGSPGEEAEAVEDVTVTLTFGADSTFAGSAGCNRYFGRFLIQGRDSLSLGPAGSTMMACPEPIMTQEYRYLQSLSGVARYRLTDAGLTLEDESGPVLRFDRPRAGQ